jgi:hypothetical protein
MNWIKATRSPISYRDHDLHQPDIDIVDMDDVRDSFSKMKKSFKRRVRGKKRALDQVGANVAGERVSSSGSFSRPDPRIVVSGHDGEGSRISTDVSQAHSKDPSPHPETVPADEGRDNPQGREVGVAKKEVSPSHLRLGPGVQDSSPNRGVKRASSPSVTPIPSTQELDGTRTISPQVLCLTTHLGDTNSPVVPDQDLHSDEGSEPSAAANDKKSGWKSTAFATAKLLLRGVRDASDAFGPLKSVAGGLCFILDNCEVRSSPAHTITTLNGAPANEGEQTNDRIVGTPGEDAC